MKTLLLTALFLLSISPANAADPFRVGGSLTQGAQIRLTANYISTRHTRLCQNLNWGTGNLDPSGSNKEYETDIADEDGEEFKIRFPAKRVGFCKQVFSHAAVDILKPGPRTTDAKMFFLISIPVSNWNPEGRRIDQTGGFTCQIPQTGGEMNCIENRTGLPMVNAYYIEPGQSVMDLEIRVTR